MSRTPGARFERESRLMWRGFGDAWTALSTMLAGIAVWGGIGFGLDVWLGTKPVLFVIGALVGNAAGIYLIYVKSVNGEGAPDMPKARELPPLESKWRRKK